MLNVLSVARALDELGNFAVSLRDRRMNVHLVLAAVGTFAFSDLTMLARVQRALLVDGNFAAAARVLLSA